LPQASGRASELLFHGWKSPEIALGETWTVWGETDWKVNRWNPTRTSAIQSRSVVFNRGYVKFKISIYILFHEWSELHYFGFNLF
jgi:hypothetical protein